MLESFLELVGEDIHGLSGGVLYSGRRAFSGPSPIYLLGLNPGGDPVKQASDTIGANIAVALSRPEDDWSEYVDGEWLKFAAGSAPLQRRVRHLLSGLGLDPRQTPASNVIFLRTCRERMLTDKERWLDTCWRMHAAVIDALSVRAVLCMGGTAGAWVRQKLRASELVDSFVEDNGRKWTSQAHRPETGSLVVTLTHPSVAAWDKPATDPTPMVRRVLGMT
ncbi:MAG TPA: hypothetical protein VGL58_09205 [Caulobacteraceae bacterium]